MTLDGTRTYIVGSERPAVIDAGPDGVVHRAAILEALGSAQPEAIILTHSHPDHAGGAKALARETGAPVVTAPAAVIETDSGQLDLIATPGHSPDHVIARWTGGDAPLAGAAFVGDLLMGEGDTTLIAPPEGNLADYLNSLTTLEALECALLFPAHGPVIRDPHGTIERYRAHRRQRLEELQAALARSPESQPAALVEEIYGAELDPRLKLAAEGSVRAMLQYLASR